MNLIKLDGDTVIQYPYSLAQLRADHPETGFYAAPDDATLAEFGAARVMLENAPAHDALRETVAEVFPARVNGVWTQQWTVFALPDATVAANAAQAEAARIAALWQAAHDLEYATISGSAIGLITMGVLSGKPKCLAVQSWIKGIWTIYYTRKANGATDTDYSGAGVCPHTVPELMAELGV